MNDERRKKLKEAVVKIDDAKQTISEVRDDEREAFDNLPESMQGGEKGEKIEAAIGALEEAEDALENAMSAIDTAME